MKLTINRQVAEEIEVTFPASFKNKINNEIYYHYEEHNKGVAIYGNGSLGSLSSWILSLNEVEPCSKEEVEQAFNRVIQNVKQSNNFS